MDRPKTNLPSLSNPFADYLIRAVASSIYLLDQLREAAWKEEDQALLMLFSPEVEDQVDELKEQLVQLFRDLAAEENPEHTFEIYPQQNLVNGKVILLLKIRDTSGET